MKHSKGTEGAAGKTPVTSAGEAVERVEFGWEEFNAPKSQYDVRGTCLMCGGKLPRNSDKGYGRKLYCGNQKEVGSCSYKNVLRLKKKYYANATRSTTKESKQHDAKGAPITNPSQE